MNNVEDDVKDFLNISDDPGGPPPEPPPAEPPAEPAPAAQEPEPYEPLPAPPEPPVEPPVVVPGEPPAPGEPPPAEPPGSSTPPPAVPASVDEMAKMRAEMEMIRAQNAELMKQLNEVAKGPTQPASATPASGEPGAPAVQGAGAQEVFIPNEEEFNKVLDKAESFNALLNKVVEKAREQALLSLPAVATQLVNQQLTLRLAVDEFYKVNTDLVGYKNFVGFVTNEIAAGHPDYDLPTLLDETAKEVRKRIGLTQMEPEAPPPAPPAAPGAPAAGGPAFVPGSPARPRTVGGGQVSGMDKEILDFISDL